VKREPSGGRAAAWHERREASGEMIESELPQGEVSAAAARGER
jgi:hypothetical protein